MLVLLLLLLLLRLLNKKRCRRGRCECSGGGWVAAKGGLRNTDGGDDGIDGEDGDVGAAAAAVLSTVIQAVSCVMSFRVVSGLCVLVVFLVATTTTRPLLALRIQ